MITAAITEFDGYPDGSHILILKKREMQELHEILTIFCNDHKRRTNAKKLLNAVDDLAIW